MTNSCCFYIKCVKQHKKKQESCSKYLIPFRTVDKSTVGPNLDGKPNIHLYLLSTTVLYYHVL